MFFNSQKLLIYLKSHSLEIYSKDNLLTLEYPLEIFNHLEVRDKSSFHKFLDEFLAKTGLKETKSLLILSEGAVFEKEILLAGNSQPDEAIETFFRKVPIKIEDLAKKTLATPDKVFLFAANKDYYETVTLVLGDFEITAEEVVPVDLFAKVPEDAKLNPELVKTILDSDQELKDGNLREIETLEKLPNKQSTELPEEQRELSEEDSTSSSSMQYLLLGLSIFFFGIAAVFTLYQFGVIKNPWEKSKPKEVLNLPPIIITPSPSPSKEATLSSSASSSASLKRDSLKMRILNGSDTPGLASKLKDQFSSLGYQDIEVGNAPNSVDTTSVSYSSKVSKDVQAEVLTQLKKTFSSVQTDKVASPSALDISIVAGK